MFSTTFNKKKSHTKCLKNAHSGNYDSMFSNENSIALPAICNGLFCIYIKAQNICVFPKNNCIVKAPEAINDLVDQFCSPESRGEFCVFSLPLPHTGHNFQIFCCGEFPCFCFAIYQAISSTTNVLQNQKWVNAALAWKNGKPPFQTLVLARTREY